MQKAQEESARAELTAPQASASWKLTSHLRSFAERGAELCELVRRGIIRLHWTRRTRQIHLARKLIHRSGLFDARWYCQQYSDARFGRPDPVLHYLLRGARNGCDPNPLFDSRWYLQQYPDVAAAGVNPLVHYLQYGAMEGRDPNPLFDTDWYLDQYPDVAASGQNPLWHYLTHGGLEGRHPSPQFDGQFYLDQHPKVRAAGLNPLGHYRLHGQAEGRGIRSVAPRLPVRWEASEAASAALQRRIVFVSGEPHTPGHAYRVAMLAKALARRGYATQTLRLDQLPAELALVTNAHALVIWRAAWSIPIATAIAAARRSGARVVFDVDDLMIDPALAQMEVIDGIRTQGFAEAAIADFYRLVRQTMLAADFCTCPTKPLAAAMRRFQKTTFVLPNGFDEARYATSRQAVAARRRDGADGLIRIGYAGGSRTHQRDFACVASAVGRILHEHPECRLLLFRLEQGDGLDLHEFPELEELESQIEWQAWIAWEQLPTALARFDINLAPLEAGNVFCEAKSELKYFEAALVDVPTVASPTVPYAEALRPEETGLLASNSEEWYAALKRLVTQPELRARMGRAACLDVLWRFGPERRAELAADIYEQVIAGQGSDAARRFELELRRASSPRRPLPESTPCEVIFEAGTAGQSQVAVAVPLYNYAQHVVEALESVKAQTLSPKDLVVMDDCSTDDSLRVAEAWLRQNAGHFAHVALLKNRRNSGLARTRNAAFAFADTRFILPLDADNMLLPDCLKHCLETMERTGAAVVFATIQEFGGGDSTRSAYPWNPGRFAGGNYIDAMALIRRAAWAAVGGYQCMKVMGWEDYELWCRFVEDGLWGDWIPETLSRYRVHAQSMLQTQTNLAENRRQVAAEMVALHPWLDASSLTGAGDASPPPDVSGTLEMPDLPETTPVPFIVVAPPAPLQSDPRPCGPERLAELLPLLRCPATGQKLRQAASDRLATEDGSRQWPLLEGHPVFFGQLEETRRFPNTHLSNQVPERAFHLVENLTGPVLNLSAGGTRTWRPHFVEVETALFRNTDIVGDAHSLPFADGVFEAVLAINAFEHYREPDRVVREILRVLKPGGLVFIHTAFLQPLHEPPWHFFNCTKYGLLQWFNRFEVVDLRVSENFNPIYALAWQANELLNVLRSERGAAVAERFAALPLRDLAAFWQRPETRTEDRWIELRQLSQGAQERLAAGFEFIGRKGPVNP